MFIGSLFCTANPKNDIAHFGTNLFLKIIEYRCNKLQHFFHMFTSDLVINLTAKPRNDFAHIDPTNEVLFIVVMYLNVLNCKII